MGFLSSLFGCSNHHWDDGFKKQERRLTKASHYPKFRVERQVKHRCQHDQCTATKITWEKVGTVRSDDLDELAKELTI